MNSAGHSGGASERVLYNVKKGNALSLLILTEGNASEQPLPHQATSNIAPVQATDENALEQVLDDANGKGTPQNMCSMIPPSTRCAAPLMPEAASEARNTVADATSSGRRKRCSSEPGSVCVKYAFASSSLLRPADTLSCALLWPADTLSCCFQGCETWYERTGQRHHLRPY